MKNFILHSPLVAFILLWFLLSPAGLQANGEPPVAATLAATGIAKGVATLNGTAHGNGSNTTVTFEYGLDTSYGSAVNASPLHVGDTATPVSAALTGLDSTLTYHYRVKAVNLDGTGYGEDMTFTPAEGAPMVTTLAATGLTTSGGTLNALIKPNGAAVTVSFEYGPTLSYGRGKLASLSPVSGGTDMTASVVVTGYQPATTLHYRVVASSPSGTVYGADKVFVTTPLPPRIDNLVVTDNRFSAITLLAGVTTNGGSTGVTFEYGLTDAYGSSTPAWETPITSVAAIVHGRISGLAAGTLYHFRVVAVNAGGTTVSEDHILTTSSAFPSPVVTGKPATNVGSTSATLNGLVNNRGAAAPALVWFEIGLTTAYSMGSIGAAPAVSGNADTPVSAFRAGLSPATTYHYRVVAQNAGIPAVYGPDTVFTTPATGWPSATTGAASGVTGSSAIINGYVSRNGGPLITAAVFEYGLTTAYGSTIAGVGNLQSSLSAMIPVTGVNTTYHYRIKATNSNGTTVGQDMTFTTPDPHDARLAALGLSSGSIQPGFNGNTTAYTVAVPYEATSVTVTPTATHGAATITVNRAVVASGSASNAIPINLGNNVVTIEVTSADGTAQRSYSVTVTRSGPGAGSLDFSFNGTGKVLATTDTIGGYGYKVALQPDGKVLVAGYGGGADTDFALMRFLPDGNLDSSFNGTGQVVTSVGSANDFGFNLTLQSDGKIVVVGSTYNGTDEDFAVLRFLPNGTLDSAFGTNGIVTTAIGDGDDSASAVKVLSDGKIVVAGTSTTASRRDFALVRYKADGTLDADFGTGGKALPVLGTHEGGGHGMTVLGDGRIIVVGWGANDTTDGLAVARYLANGTLDTSFAEQGLAITHVGNFGTDAYEVAVQSNGKLVVSAAAQNNNWDIALLRYSSEGVLDPTFGNAGITVTDFNLTTDWGNSLVLQPDGKIIVGADTDGLSVLRYNANGTLDTSFGNGGKVITRFGNADEAGYGVALQGDGKIVVAGFSTNSNISQNFAVARYLVEAPAIEVRQTSSGASVFDDGPGVDIGGTLPGASISKTFTIKNTGLADLAGLGISIDGPDAARFSVTTRPGNLLHRQESTTFTVRFSPNGLGTRSAVLHIASNVTGSNAPFDIPLSGTGTSPEIGVEQVTDIADGGSRDFGNVAVGAGASLTFTIHNSGAGALTGLAITKDGPHATQFTVTVTPASRVDAGDSTTFTVRFAPTSIGAKSAAVHVASNDGNESVFDILLTGMGVTAVLPEVKTLAATNLSHSDALLNGTVNALGSSQVVTFDYGTTASFGSAVAAAPSPLSDSTVTPVSANAIALKPHTRYYFRATATGAAGAVHGPTLTFTTIDREPILQDDSATLLPGGKVVIDVLANDTDLDNDTLSVASFKQPLTGGSVARAGSALVFTASPSFSGATFTYMASDGFGKNATATVTLTLGSCTLSPMNANPSSAANTYPVMVSATGAWGVSESVSWASVSPMSGTGNGVVHVTVQANAGMTTRTGVVVIGGKPHTIEQDKVGVPGLTQPVVPTAIVSGDYSLTIPTVNAPAIYTVGSLPPGLGMNQATGVISGRPTQAGKYPVTVKASNKAGPAKSGLSFEIEVLPLPSGIVGTFHGFIERHVLLNANLGSRLELTTTRTGDLTGKVITGVTSKVISGKLVADPLDDNHPRCRVAIQGTPLTLDLIFDGDASTVSGTLSEGGSYATPVTAWRNPWKAPDKATAFKGLHNFSLEQPETNAALPQGFGYGSFTVDETTGALTATGRLADGSAFTTVSFVGKNGQVLLYQSLYGNQGTFVGSLTVAAADHTITGTPTWFKPAPAASSQDTLYRAGFGPTSLTAEGGAYTPPLPGKVVMDLDNTTNGNAMLDFTAGGLTALQEPDVVFSIRNFDLTPAGAKHTITIPPYNAAQKPNPNPGQVTLTTLTPGTGAFSGSFTILGPPTRTVTYQGLIVPHGGVQQGYGYFLLPQVPTAGQTLTTSPRNSGRVVLKAP